MTDPQIVAPVPEEDCGQHWHLAFSKAQSALAKLAPC